MKKYFITGGTGFIGKELTKHLLKEGNEVNLLIRDRKKAEEFTQSGVKLFTGDITDANSVDEAMKGCTHVFHLAAYAKPFAKDPAVFDLINIEGTRNVLDAALKHDVKKVVFTSTAGTFGITSENEDATEASEKPGRYYTEYARTKREAEKLCEEYFKKGLDIVIVNPTRVFGPGVISEGNSITKILSLYQKGKWRIIPGNGKTYGNYVFVGDIINGHILAMEHGKPGENYILGGENLTFNELFARMSRVTGKKFRMVHIPYPVLWAAAAIMVAFARLSMKQPLISPGWVKRYLQHRRLSVIKAQNDLGYEVTPVETGLKLTVEWLKKLNNGNGQ